MTDIKNSNVQVGSYIGRDATNTVIEGRQVTDEQWQQLSKFAAKNEVDNEYTQVRDVEKLVKEGKADEAGKIWGRIRSFFDSNLARAANVAEIASFIDGLLKSTGVY